MNTGTVNKWLNIVQDFVYPPTCVLCGGPGAGMDLCAACRADFDRPETVCARCALPLVNAGTGAQLICGVCLRHPPPYQRTLAPYTYAQPLDRLILDFKFNRQWHLARVLGTLMAEHIGQHHGRRPELIVPVPLHPQRLRQRGFNQAVELARVIGKQLGITVENANYCQRIRATATQSDLSARERRRNVRGAFAVTRSLGVGHVAIVDDVMTTGHTVAEFAQTLRKSGVETVEVWICARAGVTGRAHRG